MITDLRMPSTSADDGRRAVLELRSRHRELLILIPSAYAVDPYVRELLSGPGADGGVGYLLKEKGGGGLPTSCARSTPWPGEVWSSTPRS